MNISSVHKIDLSKNVQKEPWYIKLNPNGRIPVLVDKNKNDFTIFESAAILLYLEQHYDAQLRFSFDAKTDPEEYSRLLQWIFFTVSTTSRRNLLIPVGRCRRVILLCSGRMIRD